MGGQVRTQSGTSEQVSKGDSQTGRRRWVGESGQEASEQVRGTHKLEGTDGWASQDMEWNE